MEARTARHATRMMRHRPAPGHDLQSGQIATNWGRRRVPQTLQCGSDGPDPHFFAWFAPAHWLHFRCEADKDLIRFRGYSMATQAHDALTTAAKKRIRKVFGNIH